MTTSPAVSRRQQGDELERLIESERQKSKFVRLLGARKMWLRLRGKGHDVARCTVERLMRELGIAGTQRDKKPPRTTVSDTAAARAFPGTTINLGLKYSIPRTSASRHQPKGAQCD